MKKLFVALLCVIMVISVCGCAASGAKDTTGAQAIPNSLKVGYGRVDITPTEMGLPMRGSFTARYVSGIVERMYATCIAFTDAYNNTILLYHIDLQGTYDEVFLWAKKDIEKAVGVPIDQIMVGATHMHRGPNVVKTEDEGIGRYNKQLRAWLVEAAMYALDDRKSAEMYTTSMELEGFNFVKHYLMSDGSYAGDNFGSTSGKTYVRHESEPDRELQMVKFVRQGGDDVVLVNWQAHPHRDGIKKDTISNDVISPLRDTIESLMNCKMAFFQGAAGNLNSSSRIKSEMVGANYIEQGTEMGKQIAANAKFEKAEIGKVQITKYNYVGTPREGVQAVQDIKMYAFSIGDVAFITAPYEMFSLSGEEIKEGSPFKMTFVVGYANGYVGYMPRQNNYFYGDIESYESTCCDYIQGTAEEQVAKYIEMLKQIYPTAK